MKHQFNDEIFEGMYFGEMNRIVEALKTDLSIRETNDNVGSGMGGNASQLYFLISNEITSTLINKNAKPKFFLKENNINIQMPMSWFEEENNFLSKRGDKDIIVNHILRDLRVELQKTFEKNSNLTVSDAQISDPQWLKDQNINTTDIILLIKSLLVGQQLVQNLDNKSQFIDELSKINDFEIEKLKKDYWKDMGFMDCKSSTFTINSIYKHPVWGVKLTKLDNKYRQIMALLLEGIDEESIKLINSFPMFASTLTLRNIITIERIVKFYLDEMLTDNSDI